MAIKSFKPKTPSLRGTKLLDRSIFAKDSGPRALTKHRKQHSGRNSSGRITIRHRGGMTKRRLRVVDFMREKIGVPAKVAGLYFDPNRTAYLALLNYVDGEKRYILAPKGLKEGDVIISGEQVDVLPGNAMKIKNIPSGTMVNCVEINPGKGAKLGRSAGAGLVVQGPDPSGKFIQVKMPSTEIRLINAESYATIGAIANEERVNIKIGKAGRKRHMGWRPTVRGMAMHAVQHPHGGGEGKGGIGKAKDIWGHRLDTRTRKNKRTDQYIIKGRIVRRRPSRK